MADTSRTAPPIHYMSRDRAIAHKSTNHILHPSPAPGLHRQVRLETGCADSDGAESSLCPQLAQEEVFPGYAQQG